VPHLCGHTSKGGREEPRVREWGWGRGDREWCRERKRKRERERDKKEARRREKGREGLRKKGRWKEGISLSIHHLSGPAKNVEVELNGRKRKRLSSTAPVSILNFARTPTTLKEDPTLKKLGMGQFNWDSSSKLNLLISWNSKLNASYFIECVLRLLNWALIFIVF
jgi:hypothetical protein